jgi:phosphoribosylformylglycinamidine synthase subunit PurQ / glutaminase
MSATVGIVVFPGSNCERDVAEAVDRLGGEARLLWHGDATVAGVDAVVIPGGFAHGDYLRPGAIARFSPVMAAVDDFARAGGPVIGICNGFQVLTRAGLLPGTLGHNAVGHFDCRWVTLAVESATRCVWTAAAPELIECPIAHGEGRFVHPDPDALAVAGQVALRYVGRNPNGSAADIAGVCDETGLVLGLMPHPENHVVARQHPRHRHDPSTVDTLGLGLFRSAVAHVA